MSQKKTFKVEVKETLSRIVEVEAVDECEATNMVRSMYDSEEIVLDSDNYVGTDIEIYEE